MVRVPPDVHGEPAIEAAAEDISLNRLVSVKLSS
jgi:predicted HicB family RNase H-like nuclease